MSLKFLLSILAISASSIANAGAIYKCETETGEIYYQGSPCGNQQLKVIKNTVPHELDKRLLSSTDRYAFDAYVLYEQSISAARICSANGVRSASELNQRLDRYKDIAQTYIDNGIMLSEKGTEAVSSQTLTQYLQRKIKSSAELASFSKDKIDRACGMVANKLAIAASQVPNRSSGYFEGDLDPEGND